jgi:hypothetical protein
MIYGTPDNVNELQQYTVVASNQYDSFSHAFNIIIIDSNNIVQPPNIYYGSEDVRIYTINVSIVPINPTNTGGNPTLYSLYGNTVLPDGLSLDSETGIISGMPTVVSEEILVVIKAENDYGESVANLRIRVVNEVIMMIL